MEMYAVKRLLSYISCGAAVFIGGQAWLILMYRGYIARHFSLTYYQDKFVISSGVIGASFGLPLAYVIDHVGPRWAIVTSVSTTCLGLSAIWFVGYLSTQNQPPYYILALCFFVASSGAAMSLLTGVVTSLYNVTRRHKAMVSAIIGLLYETSTQSNQLIRRFWFHSPQDESRKVVPEDVILPRFTLILTTITIIGGFLAFAFIRAFQESRYFDDEEDDERLLCAIGVCRVYHEEDEPDLSSTNVLQWKSSQSVWKLFGTFEYQCLIWSSGLFLALSQFSRLSMPPYIPFKSVPGIEETNRLTLILTCTYSAAAILSRFPLACLVDTYNERLFVYLVLFCIKLLGFLNHFLLFMNWSTVVLVTFYVISGILDGACFFEIIVLTCQMFGYQKLARNIAIPMLMKSVIIACLEYIHLTISVSHVDDVTQAFCYGMTCEFGTSVIRLVLSAIAVTIFVPLILIRSRTFSFSDCKTCTNID